ncbi:hypothetical protein CD116_13005 [Staphylococcus schweitzeri]|uniref:Uncharacterized protein n=1 Tax=Staphylococcus schweitzeri TaxID=1654388 RepID=A0A2K4ADQ1_9STAP|nr:hypothetical protein CD116_13005 [Staphylococcus schweitzeri]
MWKLGWEIEINFVNISFLSHSLVFISILTRHHTNLEKNHYIISYTLAKQHKKPPTSLHKSDLDGFID